MKRIAGTTGKSWSSKRAKNATPPAPPATSPQRIKLVQSSGSAPAAAKPGSGKPGRGKADLSKKADVPVAPAKKGRR